MPGIVTLKSRQRRMVDWMNLPNYMYFGIGRTTAWSDEMHPPVPDETATEVEELIGLQMIDSKKYAKVIPNPTTLDKKSGVYYKGLYYEVTDNKDYALEHGFTSIMVRVTFDRDTLEEAIPIDVTFRQVGLYVMVNPPKSTGGKIPIGITADQWNSMSAADKGTLEVIDNRVPLTRQDDQQEELYCVISF